MASPRRQTGHGGATLPGGKTGHSATKTAVTGSELTTARPAGARSKRTARSEEAPTKKNLRLHQSKIDAARAILGTGTETETVETALDLVVFRKELVDGVRAMRGAKLHNLFDDTDNRSAGGA
ncbi:MAG: hypothetical protein WKG32_02680 [Gemmatimonadaceae bacterium]